MKQTCPACKSKDLALEAADVTIEHLMAQRLKLLDALDTAITVIEEYQAASIRQGFPSPEVKKLRDARDQAGYLRGLDEAKQACLQKHANGNWKHDTREECAAAIEELKVEP